MICQCLIITIILEDELEKYKKHWMTFHLKATTKRNVHRTNKKIIKGLKKKFNDRLIDTSWLQKTNIM